MTVKELIEKLGRMDPEAIVIVRAYEEGYNTANNISVTNVVEWNNDEWYY